MGWQLVEAVGDKGGEEAPLLEVCIDMGLARKDAPRVLAYLRNNRNICEPSTYVERWPILPIPCGMIVFFICQYNIDKFLFGNYSQAPSNTYASTGRKEIDGRRQLD